MNLCNVCGAEFQPLAPSPRKQLYCRDCDKRISSRKAALSLYGAYALGMFELAIQAIEMGCRTLNRVPHLDLPVPSKYDDLLTLHRTVQATLPGLKQAVGRASLSLRPSPSAASGGG